MKRIINHELGVPLSVSLRIPLFGNIKAYEPAWRYYYIVRNSTVLLIERKIDIVFYLRQLLYYATPLIFCNGIMKFLKTFTLALIHALSKKLGYLDRKIL